MATIDNYTVNIQVKGDQDVKNLTVLNEKLGESMTHVNEKFELMRTGAEKFAVAIAGIGMAEFIRKIAESAAQTKDLSEAFGLSIESVLELQAGFQKAGRDGDAMSRMMTSLSQKAIEAADGSLKVMNAFEDLGVTFNDLKTMSMDEVMLKIGKAMEESKGSAKSIASAMEILGKGAKGVPWGDFVAGLERAQGKMGEAAHGVEEFDKSMKMLEQSAADIKREFMTLLTPVVEVLNKMFEGGNNAKTAAEGLAIAMAAIGGSLIISGLTTVIGAYKSLAVMIGITTTEEVAETVALSANSVALIENAGARAIELRAKVESLKASILLAESTIAESMAADKNTVSAIENAAAKRVVLYNTRILAIAEAELAGASALAATALQAEAGAAATAATATTAFGTAIKFVMANLGPIALAVTAAATAYELWSLYSDKNKEKLKQQGDEAVKTAEKVKNSGVLPDNQKQLNQQASVEQSLRNQFETQALMSTQAEKRLQMQKEVIGLSEIEKTTRLAQLDQEQKKTQEILKLTQDIERLETQAKNDPEGAAKYAGQLTIMRNQLDIASKQVSKTAELTTQLKIAEQEQMKFKFGQDLQLKAMDEMISIQNQINQLTMTGSQIAIDNINQKIQAEARAEVKRREALLGNGETLSLLEQIDILHQVEKAYDPIIRKQKELNDQSRTFETGWKKAFNSYMDDATNAAKRGEEVFNSMTSRMNSAIDNFVETGKFSFADFSRSIIQDLIKIELKAQATQLLGAITGGGGIIGGIASLLGFAEGGDPPTNRPSIVGENGPEIFVPKTAGTIIPNNGTASQLSASAAGTTVNNYITNNISAIDSKSVAQMFAENRRTLLGTMQLAQKENSYAIR